MLDQFFTPPPVAERIIQSIEGLQPGTTYVDPNCGSGNLLAAAEKFGVGGRFFGLDIDRSNIRRLRSQKPSWVLSAADFLSKRSRQMTTVARLVSSCDVLLVNPPFSMRGRKSLRFHVGDSEFTGSIAMAHILSALDQFSNPSQVVVIAPESLLHSDLDEAGRKRLFSEYNYSLTEKLGRDTFSGAHVHTAVIILSKRDSPLQFCADPSNSPKKSTSPLGLVRGTAQPHSIRENTNGVSFIHTTDLKIISNDCTYGGNRTIDSDGKRTVEGTGVLFPRVGSPNKNHVVAYNFHEKCVLSDCLIAFPTVSFSLAERTVRCVRDNWSEFCRIYNGTAARYTTISKLDAFIDSYCRVE